MFNMMADKLMNTYDAVILNASTLARNLVAALQESDPDHETFEQSGILNGHELICDFLRHNERECAMHHLLYVIHESDINYPKDELQKVHRTAEAMGVRNDYV